MKPQSWPLYFALKHATSSKRNEQLQHESFWEKKLIFGVLQLETTKKTYPTTFVYWKWSEIIVEESTMLTLGFYNKEFYWKLNETYKASKTSIILYIHDVGPQHITNTNKKLATRSWCAMVKCNNFYSKMISHGTQGIWLSLIWTCSMV